MRIDLTVHGDVHLEHEFRRRHAVLASAAAIGLAITPRARQVPVRAATAAVQIMAPEWRGMSVPSAVSAIESSTNDRVVRTSARQALGAAIKADVHVGYAASPSPSPLEGEAIARVILNRANATSAHQVSRTGAAAGEEAGYAAAISEPTAPHQVPRTGASETCSAETKKTTNYRRAK